MSRIQASLLQSGAKGAWKKDIASAGEEIRVLLAKSSCPAADQLSQIASLIAVAGYLYDDLVHTAKARKGQNPADEALPQRSAHKLVELWGRYQTLQALLFELAGGSSAAFSKNSYMARLEVLASGTEHLMIELAAGLGQNQHLSGAAPIIDWTIERLSTLLGTQTAVKELIENLA